MCYRHRRQFFFVKGQAARHSEVLPGLISPPIGCHAFRSSRERQLRHKGSDRPGEGNPVALDGAMGGVMLFDRKIGPNDTLITPARGEHHIVKLRDAARGFAQLRAVTPTALAGPCALIPPTSHCSHFFVSGHSGGETLYGAPASGGDQHCGAQRFDPDCEPPAL
jgi:hypothetical protein